MAKSLQVTVTNTDDLNTLQGELVTQNYNLEILGLKNPADFRKFSKSLMILDRILKETNDKVDNGLKTKLDKGSYEGDADDLKREIDGKEPAFEKKTGFNLEKTSDYKAADVNKVFTQQGANSLYKEKYDKTGGDITGNVSIKKNGVKEINFYDAGNMHYMQLSSSGNDGGLMFINKMTNYGIYLDGNGHTRIDAPNLVTVNKEIVAAINELNSNKFSTKGGEINGSVLINTVDDSHSFVIQNPNLPGRNNRMAFGFRNNVARIRLYGSSKEIRDNGFNIEGDNNKILFRVDNDGNILEKGTDKVLTLKTKEFLGNAGLSSVDYIQTPGKKYKDSGYTDRDTGRLYLCINQTTDTTVTENFKLATNLELAKYIQITNIYKSGDWMGKHILIILKECL